MVYTEAQFARLPKWAQSELQRLNANIADAEERARAAFGADETTIEVSPHRSAEDGQARTFLPDRTVIRFRLATGYVEASIRDGSLHLLAGRRLSVRPWASNVVTVEDDPR